jgi:phosphoglycerate kinase
MSYSFSRLESAGLVNQRVFLRVDYNVPYNKETKEVADLTRVKATIPTINELLKQGASVVLCTHLGRPISPNDKQYSTEFLCPVISDLLGKPVSFIPGAIESEAQEKIQQIQPGQVALLENIRFYNEETSDEIATRETFAQSLMSHFDIYVNDAFGACHRAHASTENCAKLMKSYPGLLVQREFEILSKILVNPPKPFVAIIGGAKVSTKLEVLEFLVKKVNYLLLGGAMTYTLMKSRLMDIGNSLVENEYLSRAFQVVDKANYHQCDLQLPEDHVIVQRLEEGAKKKVASKQIPVGWMGVDIGPKTVSKYTKILKQAKTVLWNGPMGVFEHPPFDSGTNSLANVLGNLDAFSVVGGGDSIAAIEACNTAENITHISTGGGATLEFLSGKKLPGLNALNQSNN